MDVGATLSYAIRGENSQMWSQDVLLQLINLCSLFLHSKPNHGLCPIPFHVNEIKYV